MFKFMARFMLLYGMLACFAGSLGCEEPPRKAGPACPMATECTKPKRVEYETKSHTPRMADINDLELALCRFNLG